MKELMEERKVPHITDTHSWKRKASDAVKELDREIKNVEIENPDSDDYNHERAIKTVNYLKALTERLEKEERNLRKLTR